MKQYTQLYEGDFIIREEERFCLGKVCCDRCTVSGKREGIPFLNDQCVSSSEAKLCGFTIRDTCIQLHRK